jgi:FkbM family methyltransferase
MRLTRRTLAAVSRRLERPELLAAFYPGARQELREEIAIGAVLASSLRSDASYVDVGANRGQILRNAVRVAPRGSHVAFEPIPALVAGLERAFPSVDCRQMALGARAQSATFCHFTGGQMDGHSGLRRSPEVTDERGRPEYITVKVSTLDDEIGELLPAVVKIDVEGSELDVIQGARALLAAARPLLIFEHVPTAAALYGARSEALWDLLDELHYEVFSITGDGPFSRQAFAQSRQIVNWLARPFATNGAHQRYTATNGPR